MKNQIEQEKTNDYVEKLQEIFEYYCQYGERLNSTILKSHKYIKLFRESGLMDKKIDNTPKYGTIQNTVVEDHNNSYYDSRVVTERNSNFNSSQKDNFSRMEESKSSSESNSFVEKLNSENLPKIKTNSIFGVNFLQNDLLKKETKNDSSNEDGNNQRTYTESNKFFFDSSERKKIKEKFREN